MSTDLSTALDNLVTALGSVPALDELAVLMQATAEIQGARWAALVGPEEAELQVTFWLALSAVAQAVHETRKEATA